MYISDTCRGGRRRRRVGILKSPARPLRYACTYIIYLYTYMVCTYLPKGGGGVVVPGALYTRMRVPTYKYFLAGRYT